MTSPLEISRTSGIATLSLNRPKCLNAISPELRDLLADTLEELGHDGEIRAIVIRGNGPAFCGGGDIRHMKQEGLAHARARLEKVARAANLLIAGPKPVVACVEGAAYGAGLSIVAACDYIVATPEARFGAPFSNLGLAADWGLTWTLPRRIGAARAKQMCLLADVLDANEAKAAGLVDEICAADDIMSRAIAVAGQFAAGPPLATAATRRAFAMAPGSSEEALANETITQAALLQTDDHREGVQAFLEKRTPHFHET